MTICECCKISSVEIIEKCDDENYPYKICKECHHRLINKALRPLEYFNLTAKHGHLHLLHDDFYDKDGTASQPEIDVVLEKGLEFPTLNSVKNNLERLIDYSISIWFLNNNIIKEFQKFEKQLILNSFDKRINEVRSIDFKIYELTAKILGPFAEKWIKSEWEKRTNENFPIYAECLANCLPLEEGFKYFTKELDSIDTPSKLSNDLLGLIYFQSKMSLDWIENNINRVVNISHSWGYLAVESEFDWATVKKWLEAGRPLSLVALDAVINCSTTTETMNSTIRLKENPKRLIYPDTIENMNNFLFEYIKKDNVARVRNNIEFILKAGLTY